MRHYGMAKSLTGRNRTTKRIRCWMGVLLALSGSIGAIGPVRAGTGNTDGSWVTVSLPQRPGQARNPSGVAVDGAGNLYVSESFDANNRFLGNNRVQERSASGTWSIIASTGTDPGQVSDPSGVAVDGAGNMYVSEGYPNNRVQERTVSGTWSVIAAGGTDPGQVSDPEGVAVDGAGNLYVADHLNSRVQERSASGTWSVIASEGTDHGQVYDPSGVAVDGAGNLYVTEPSNLRVQERSASGTWSVIATAGVDLGQVYEPFGVAVDRAGSLYVSEIDYTNHNNSRVQERSASGTWSVIATAGVNPGQVNEPRGVAVDGAGNLYVADTNNDRVQERSASGTWAVIAATGGTDPGQVLGPSGVAVDGAGNMYVSEGYPNNRVQERTVSGTWSVIATDGYNLPGQVLSPSGLAVDGAGNLYVADLGNSRVQERSASGTWSVIASRGTGPGQVQNPEGVAVDGAGNLYVADTANDRVQERSASGTWAVIAAAGVYLGQVYEPSGVAVDGAGNLYVTEWKNSPLQERSASGTWSLIASVGVNPGQVYAPQSVAVDGAGNLYVVDNGNNRVQERSASGTWSIIAPRGADSGQANDPAGVAVDGAGNLYVSDYGNDRIQKYTTAGSPVPASPPIVYPNNPAIDMGDLKASPIDLTITAGSSLVHQQLTVTWTGNDTLDVSGFSTSPLSRFNGNPLPPGQLAPALSAAVFPLLNMPQGGFANLYYDVVAPIDTPDGDYTGSLEVAADSTSTAKPHSRTVPVTVHVREQHPDLVILMDGTWNQTDFSILKKGLAQASIPWVEYENDVGGKATDTARDVKHLYALLTTGGEFKHQDDFPGNERFPVTRSTTVDIIAHSYGGLVARRFANMNAKNPIITLRNIITLGTPLGGINGVDHLSDTLNDPFIVAKASSTIAFDKTKELGDGLIPSAVRGGVAGITGAFSGIATGVVWTPASLFGVRAVPYDMGESVVQGHPDWFSDAGAGLQATPPQYWIIGGDDPNELLLGNDISQYDPKPSDGLVSTRSVSGADPGYQLWPPGTLKTPDDHDTSSDHPRRIRMLHRTHSQLVTDLKALVYIFVILNGGEWAGLDGSAQSQPLNAEPSAVPLQAQPAIGRQLLDQTILAGVGTDGEQFPVDTTSNLTVSVVSAAAGDVTLRGPDGLQVPGETETIGQDWTATGFFVPTPSPGVWSVHLASPTIDALTAVVATADSDLGVSVETPTPLAPAAPLILHAALNPGSAAAATQVSADILGPGGLVATHPMLADPVQQASDSGVAGFSLSVDAPSVPGTYRITIAAAGTRNGQPFRRETATTLQVVSQAAAIVSLGPETQILGAGGTVERVNVAANITLSEPGDYTITGDLLDSRGIVIAHGSGDAYGLSAGPQSVLLGISGASLREAGEAGPFTLTHLVLSQLAQEGPPVPVAVSATSFVTLPYMTSAFVHPPTVRFISPGSETTVAAGSFPILWSVNDPDASDATVALFAERINSGALPVLLGSGLPLDGRFDLQTGTLPRGDYRIYLTVQDGLNPAGKFVAPALMHLIAGVVLGARVNPASITSLINQPRVIAIDVAHSVDAGRIAEVIVSVKGPGEIQPRAVVRVILPGGSASLLDPATGNWVSASQDGTSHAVSTATASIDLSKVSTASAGRFLTVQLPLALRRAVQNASVAASVIDTQGVTTQFGDVATWTIIPGAVLGDLTGDGHVDLRDVTLLLRIAIGTVISTDLQRSTGDINGDGHLDLKDATELLQVAVGIRGL